MPNPHRLSNIVESFSETPAAPAAVAAGSPNDDLKVRRKVIVVRLKQITEYSQIQPGQRKFDISIPVDLELADSIKTEVGQLTPIILKRNEISSQGEMTYKLIDGHRRFGAIKHNAGDKWAESTIVAELLAAGEDEFMVAIHRNLGVSPLSPAQRGDMYTRLIASDNSLTPEKIAKKYHLGAAYVAKVIRAWDSPPPVRALLEKNLPIDDALTLRAAVGRLNPEWVEDQTINITKLDVSGAKRFIDALGKGLPPDESLVFAISGNTPGVLASIAPVASSGITPYASKETKPSKSARPDAQLEQLLGSFGVRPNTAQALIRSGKSDSLEVVLLAGIATRRGMPNDKALETARVILRSRYGRRWAFGLSAALAKALSMPADKAEGERKYLLYLFGLEEDSAEIYKLLTTKKGKK